MYAPAHVCPIIQVLLGELSWGRRGGIWGGTFPVGHPQLITSRVNFHQIKGGGFSET